MPIRAVVKIIKKYYEELYLFVRRVRHLPGLDKRSLGFDWEAINYNRISVLFLIMTAFRNPRYLEIGCSSNATFNSIPFGDKVGVDPFRGGNLRLFSDEFFAQNFKKFDVIFIDGDHTYEQVRRDVINALRSLERGGWIVLHDMLPRDAIESHVPLLENGPWTGDVWKVGFELARIQSIPFKIFKIDFGVGVLRCPSKEIEWDQNNYLNLSSKTFSYYHDNLSILPIVSFEEGAQWIRDTLASKNIEESRSF